MVWILWIFVNFVVGVRGVCFLWWQARKNQKTRVVVEKKKKKKKKKSEIRHILNCLIGSNWIDSSKYFWFFLTFFFLLGGSRFVWMHPVHTHKPTSPGVVVGMSRARARARASARAINKARAREKINCPGDHLLPDYWSWGPILRFAKL